MKFISICSGIEAASVAFAPLGWKAIAFSEIEPFPCAVLAHHYPDVPNFGDMTKFREWPEQIFIEADAIVGGPPCQAFSVAGLRAGLSDDRGNLTLTYAELINHADAIRTRAGKQPVVVLYENVPGLLSDKTGAFGSLLGALAGEDGELQPPGKKWTNAGCVSGPERALAWAVTDAQFFGVAQRRRRVFLIGSARKGFDPATILFEPDSVRRDTAPSREARQVAPTIPARSTAGGGLGTDFDCDGGVVQVCPTLRAGGNRTGGDRPPGTDVDTADSLIVQMDHTLRGEGFGASEDGTGRGTPLVPVETKDVRYAYYSHDYANDRITDVSGINPALTARDRASGNLNVAVPVAYGIRTANTSSNGWGVQEEYTHTLDCAQGVAVAQPVVHAIQAGALRVNPASGPDGVGVQADHAYTLEARAEVQAVAFAENSTARIRRITPLEAERLMGFPDNYTAIPWRGKPADQCPDGPRYRALGNSWAVPNVRWIGQRIDAAVRRLQ